MKRLLAIIIGLVGIINPLWAEHIKGGELFYTYAGPSGANSSVYTLTLKLYIDCNATSTGQLDAQVGLSVFNKSNNSLVTVANAPFSSESFINFDPNSNPCIGNPPRDVCYRIRIYTINVTLPNTSAGYTVAYQRCCRIRGIINLTAPSDASGATYYCEIPGTGILADAYQNKGPQFSANDATAICSGSAFSWDFSATQGDQGDSLVYAFCSGYSGASQATPNPTTSATPPYNELSYNGGYGGSSPLGPKVTINRTTGLISGIAPHTLGQYVVTVCVFEYRKGTLINVHKKDIHVRVSDCIPLRAYLQPDYAYCDDFLVTFKNEQVNPPGSLYIWEYGDNTKADTSTDVVGQTTHQFADTGTYKVKLKVILAGQCVDSTTTLAKVYPGFYPGFTTLGTCVLLPLQFTDTTKSRYGAASKWRWNFGDETTLADTSIQSSPQWKYSTTGFKDIQLIVESNKGCIDTVLRKVEVRDKPPINLAFKDTLICSIDTLELKASGLGLYSWTPGYNILNPNTPNPLVYPKVTSNYTVTLNENGCVNSDVVRVRVVDRVTLDAGPDSTICLTDPARLNPSGDGLKFVWTPASSLNNANIKNPIATPAVTTTYQVTASIGKCDATDNVTIKAIPYPGSEAGPDTTICYDDTAMLHAKIVGSTFNWTPSTTLSDANTLDPLAFPLRTTTYVLRVYDNLGCPKPGVSEVVVTVKPKINAFAGNDTSIVVGQPLVLTGSGAQFFEWTPPIGLNRRDVSQPTAVLDDNMSYIMKAFTAEGCFAYDTINVKVFKTQPDIFMPNAFNPSGTRNPVLRPIMAGVSKLEHFRVYNRWGQMVFQTVEAGKGWDGMVGGKPQDAGTYVWMVQGKDYTGKTITKKGTALLLR